MSLWHLVIREILHRKLGFVLATGSVLVAIGSLVGALALLDAHDVRTARLIEAKQAETKQNMDRLEDDMRKAMLNLGFNVVILPADQQLNDWYADDFAAATMPEEYVAQLTKAKIVTIQHLLPVLQQKIRWPEQKRTIILVGTRGELPSAGTKKAMVDPVAPGSIVLGYELHDSLGLKRGDTVTLMGRDFTVSNCYTMRGNKDDITAWIHLGVAQELLDKKGRINAILALECACAWSDLPKVRDEIGRILPDTQLIERGSEALARAEARRKVAAEATASIARDEAHRARMRAERERLAAILVPLAMAGAAVLIFLLMLGNARDRAPEVGVLRAVGVRSGQILALFLSKALAMGMIGGAVGCAAGFLAASRLSGPLDAGAAQAVITQVPFRGMYVVLALVAGPVLSVLAAWIPALLAAQQDPAVILREE